MKGQPPEDLARLLAKSEGLGPLSEERSRWLARRVPEMRIGEDHVLWWPAQEARMVFVLLEGRVRVYKTLGGDELTLEIVEVGHLFGDVATLAGRRRGTYAQALAPSRVALLGPDVLNNLVREEPEVGLRLSRRLSGNLYEYRERMADVALKKVSARLASLLLRLLRSEGVVTREGVGVRTRYTHEQFAAMIGAKRVAVSRAMAELRELGAVEVKGRRVYLRDDPALRKAAEAGQREP